MCNESCTLTCTNHHAVHVIAAVACKAPGCAANETGGVGAYACAHVTGLVPQSCSFLPGRWTPCPGCVREQASQHPDKPAQTPARTGACAHKHCSVEKDKVTLWRALQTCNKRLMSFIVLLTKIRAKPQLCSACGDVYVQCLAASVREGHAQPVSAPRQG